MQVIIKQNIVDFKGEIKPSCSNNVKKQVLFFPKQYQLDVTTPTNHSNFSEMVFASGNFFHLFSLHTSLSQQKVKKPARTK